MNLTTVLNRDYPFAQVLNTPLEADSPAPDSRGFFTSIVCLWLGSGQRYNTGESRESCKPSSSGVQVPGRSSEQGAKFEHISKEVIMTALTILTTEIRQLAGLYSLNDLHKAAGSNKNHQPANFLRLDTAQALIDEIHSSEMRSASKTINGGPNRGTYVCRELVIAYAAWISAAFHLKVIRVFLEQATPELMQIPQQFITAAQAGELATLIQERFPDGADRAYAWSRFNKHFRIARYRELPQAKFEEACGYVPHMPRKNETKLLNDKTTYNYPRKLLEQSGFVSDDGKYPARLDMSMLSNTKAFISPLMHLLNEMRSDGHDVSAPWDEFIAMREALVAADKVLKKIYIEAMQVRFFKSASTAGNK